MQAFYTLADLQNWSHHSVALTPPARLAVIGDPIAHSKSPQMHNAALLADGTQAQYIRVQVPVGQVAVALDAFRSAGFWGVNVTIPHKFEALATVDEVDPLAQQLGAVNTVHITDTGRLMGYNSDGPGFINSVREAFATELSGKRILILGAGGGAGSAVAIQSALAGATQVLLVNRTVEKLAPLQQQIQQLSPSCDSRIIPWTPDALAATLPGVELIVNATALGMKAEDAPLLPAHSLTPQHLVYDMVYRAGGYTALGTAALEAKARYTDGQLLLLHQGAISYQHWFKKQAPLSALRAGLKSAIQA
jgi:shikimate dehydrogenase